MNDENKPPAYVDTRYSHGAYLGDHGIQINVNAPRRETLPKRRWIITGGAFFVALVLFTVAAVTLEMRNHSPAAQAGTDLAVSARIIDRDANGLSTVVPGNYVPPIQFFDQVGAVTDPAFADALYAAGGVRIPPVNLEIVLTGQVDRELRILDIEPVIVNRTDPLDGSYFMLGSQSQTNNIEMAVNFDDPKPIARVVTKKTPNGVPVELGGPYFDQHKIALKRGEREVVHMPLRVTKYNVEFDLKIVYADGDSEKSLSLDNGGNHFRITGMRLGADSESLPPYQNIYTYDGNFNLCRVEDSVKLSEVSNHCLRPR